MSNAKQRRRFDERAMAVDKLSQEWFGERPKPAPTVPTPLSEMEKERFNKLEETVNIVTDLEGDPRLIFEIVDLGSYTNPQSIRRLELARKINHYMTLKQQAAKEKLWRQMYRIIYGFKTEVESAKRSREQTERGGSGAQ